MNNTKSNMICEIHNIEMHKYAHNDEYFCTECHWLKTPVSADFVLAIFDDVKIFLEPLDSAYARMILKKINETETRIRNKGFMTGTYAKPTEPKPV